MEIIIRRIAKRSDYTIGRMYVDGRYVCDTLEDTDRGLTSAMSDKEIRRQKVPGKTAIPSGEYMVSLNVISPRFGNRYFYRSLCGGIPFFSSRTLQKRRTLSNVSCSIL